MVRGTRIHMQMETLDTVAPLYSTHARFPALPTSFSFKMQISPES